MRTVLSFDVEEHHRIESAAGQHVDSALCEHYRERMIRSTEWILEQLAHQNIRATFFVLGQIAESLPGLVRSIHEGGHEVASHGWDHRRIHVMTIESFREDIRMSKDALEQATGAAVLGYRAPTFSIVRQTAWALDVLAEIGFLYDSSIYPVLHDRYGIVDAPNGPFLARGLEREILELPPASVRVVGIRIPIGGGGYFRLLPYSLMMQALAWSRSEPGAGATVLYFHPWEFDPDLPRLPLNPLSSFRTYVGIRHTRNRLSKLLPAFSFVRASDLAHELLQKRGELSGFHPAASW
jgi:polysaccharide deacetylase family protein (PEP-CTERM system associated)